MPSLSVEHGGQGAAHNFAQRELRARGVEPQLANLRGGQFYGEGDLGWADWNRLAEALGSL
jgi:hypothetical protein